MELPKLYVFDLDGTLLTSEKRILPSTKVALSLLSGLGARIVLASARPPKAIVPVLNELGLQTVYAALNGALVVHGDEILWQGPLEPQAAQKVIGIALHRRLSVNLYTNWEWYTQKENSWSKREEDLVGFPVQVRDLSGISPIHKLLLIGEQQEISAMQAELKIEAPAVDASRSNPNYLEVVARGVSKARALRIVCKLNGIELKDTAAFGDGENDLALLQTAGFSVAMGNAHPALVAQADLVTESNDADGIFWAVQKLLRRGGVNR